MNETRHQILTANEGKREPVRLESPEENPLCKHESSFFGSRFVICGQAAKQGKGRETWLRDSEMSWPRKMYLQIKVDSAFYDIFILSGGLRH